jgi:hypothetical protein
MKRRYRVKGLRPGSVVHFGFHSMDHGRELDVDGAVMLSDEQAKLAGQRFELEPLDVPAPAAAKKS